MNLHKSLWTIVIIVAITGRPTSTPADTVYLKDGGTLEGKVTEENDHIVVRIGSIKTTVEKERVLRIEKKPSPREEYAERLGAIAPEDAERHYELGVWCLDKKLPTQARDCFMRVVAIQPDHPEARRRLGHVMREGKWVKPCAKCGGTGKADCPVCKATGVVRVSCQQCIKGKKTCEVCQGQGFLMCQNCQGAGGFTCMACGGAGGHWAQEWVWVNGMFQRQPVWNSCPQCGGNGRLDCPNCVGGRVDCPRCKKGKYECPSCDGRGYRRDPCQACNGAKKTDCPICEGRGYTEEGTPSLSTEPPEATAPPGVTGAQTY